MHWKNRSDVSGPSEPPFPMPEPIWNSLYSRGFQSESAVRNLFSPSLQDLKDPFTIKNMEAACDRLVDAFKKNQKITIYADFDLDGTSGLALLYDGLSQLGFKNLNYTQPKRLADGYGLHPHMIEELASNGTDVVVTIDVGITALEAAQTAKQCGIDLIITDHHLPYDELPAAYTIVNPNQKDCTSGLGYLCGAGVGFYLLMALKKVMAEKNLLSGQIDLKNVLDYYVIGTLTDLVPLVGDNRVLVKHGLIKISNTRRPALRKLIDTLNLNDRIMSSQEVAINLAPKLNALSRMESDVLPRDVLLERDQSKASEIVKNVLRVQEERKRSQQGAYLKALELKETMSQVGYVWVWSHEFHKGVIGLVATKLCELLNVPAFVGSINEKGEVSGSARCPDGLEFDLTQVLDFSKTSLLKYGGHAQAAGFSLDATKALEFDELLNVYFSKNLRPQARRDVVYDSVATFDQLTPQFMKWYENLEPFGKDFPPFVFRFNDVSIVNIKKMNGGHLRFGLQQDGVDQIFNAVVFSPSDSYKNLVQGAVIDILAEARWNYFRGQRSLQLNLRDISVK